LMRASSLDNALSRGKKSHRSARPEPREEFE
jgi:hypothetical protein